MSRNRSTWHKQKNIIKRWGKWDQKEMKWILNTIMSANPMIVRMCLFSVFSSERWEVGLDHFQAPPEHSIQRLWLIDHDSLNYGWSQSCAKFTSHWSKETNSPWAKPYELITKAHWDKWESIRFLFKRPGVLHSVCCSSINVGVLDHVYGHNSFCKTVAASAETNSGVLSSRYPEHLSPHWANSWEEVVF